MKPNPFTHGSQDGQIHNRHVTSATEADRRRTGLGRCDYIISFTRNRSIMIQRILLPVLFVLLWAAVSSRGESAEESYLKNGEQKCHFGDYKGAITDFTEAIRLNPNDAVAYYDRGTAKNRTGDHDGAIADYTEAIRINPNYTEAYSDRDVAKFEKGDHGGAFANSKEDIRINQKKPNNIDPKFEFGRIDQIDPDTQTFTLKRISRKTEFTLSRKGKIFLPSKAQLFSDLKLGDRVAVAYFTRTDGKRLVTCIFPNSYLLWAITLFLGFNVLSLWSLGFILLKWRKIFLRKIGTDQGFDVGVWNGKEVVILAFLFLFLFSLMHFFIKILDYFKCSHSTLFLAYITVVIGFYSLLFIAVLFLLKHKRTTWRDAFEFIKLKPQKMLMDALISLAAIGIPIELSESIMKRLFQVLNWSRKPLIYYHIALDSFWKKTFFALCLIIFAPVFEEILFRGILYNFFKGKMGVVHAIWLTSFLFALAHFQIFGFPARFLIGIALAVLYESRRNLVSSMTLHSIFNALCVVMMLIRDYLGYSFW